MPTDLLPYLSIVTPSFNGEAYLPHLLECLKKQTFGKWEHIVIDNCSTDSTLQILERWRDPRRKVISEKDEGQSQAINKGFSVARGEILCWINVDDYYYSPDVLEKVCARLADNSVDIVYGTGFWRYEPQGIEKPIWIDPDTQNIGTRFLRHIGLCQPAVFWRRSAFDKSGVVDESLHYAMDFDLWCRFAKTNARWSHLPEPLVVHRVHDDMKTVKQRGRSLIESLLVVLRHYGMVSDNWMSRLVEYYCKGSIGLQNDAAPANDLSKEQCSLIEALLLAIFRDGDSLRVRALVGLLMTPTNDFSDQRLRGMLNDITRCVASALPFAEGASFDRCIAEIQVALDAEGWRLNAKSPATLGASFTHQTELTASPALTPSAPIRPAGKTAHKPAVDPFGYGRLLRFKERFRGEECVLMCNGPSLRTVDFSLIRSRRLIGLNKIYLGLSLIGRSPDMVVCVNKKVLEQSAEKFCDMKALKFFGNRAGTVMPADPLTFYFNSSDSTAPRFSKDIVKNVHEGWTVTHAALQILYYMGFSKIIIVGMDHNFPKSEGRPNESQVMAGADLNHFDPNYFGYGQHWDLPDLVNSEISYREARKLFEEDGRIIIDATEEGYCKIFERMTLVKALGYPTPKR